MCKKINLTHHQKTQYTNPALAKSSVGIGLPVNIGVNYTPTTVCVFFIAKNSIISTPVKGVPMMSCVGVSQDTLFPMYSKTNPAQLITSFDWSLIGDAKLSSTLEPSKMTTQSIATPVVNPSVLNFQFQNSASIRSIIINGEIWFVASDIASVLAYRMASDMARFLDEDEKATHNLRTPYGEQNFTIINESGLYSAIIRSRKPEAKIFKKWVTSEVLPAIRKTGSYTAPQQTAPAPEYINSNDWNNLKRLIWICEKEFNCKKSAGLAIWGRLREITGVKSPEKFEVKHLPILAQEFQRILSVIEHYSNIKYQTEKNLIKHILRNGQDEVLDLLMNEFAEKSQTFQEDLQKPLFNIFNTDCVKLLNRQ